MVNIVEIDGNPWRKPEKLWKSCWTTQETYGKSCGKADDPWMIFSCLDNVLLSESGFSTSRVYRRVVD
jgi:hypothetical protein